MAAAAVLAGGVGAATSRAQQAKPVVYSPRSACRLVQTVLPLADELEDTRTVRQVNEIWLTPAGFTVSLPESRVESIKYSDSPGVKPYGKDKAYKIDFFPERTFAFQRGFVLDFHEKTAADIKLYALVGALNFLITSAHQDQGIDCKAVLDDQAQLDSFAQATADWRKLLLKPPLSEEVNRQRLLAEDAAARQDSSDALEDYLAGLDTDPTWAQGWFNAALLFAEQQNYDDAVFSMKHYLILLPDAPDAAAAKEKVSLWVAKMHETAAAAPAGRGRKAK
jgi:hypothetical protein